MKQIVAPLRTALLAIAIFSVLTWSTGAAQPKKVIFETDMCLDVDDGKAKRLRVIVTSDFPPFPVTNSDPDDVQSMVRFLLYANEFDIEGLIASAAT